MIHTPNSEVYSAICERVSKNPDTSANGHCPCHADSTGSLSVKLGQDGTILIKCFAGCETKDIVRELDFEMSDLFPDDHKKTSSKNKPHKKANLNVEKLAANKRIPVESLVKWGVITESDDYWGRYVRILYYDIDKKEIPVTRLRIGLKGRESRWKTGDKPTLYGQWFMPRIRELKYVVIVEGESDCWTLWHHGYPAMGLPGAAQAGKLQPAHVAGLEKIFVFIEPDKGGVTFSKKVPARLKELGFEGAVYRVFLDDYKDPNDLHRKVDADEFKRIFQAALNAESPIDLETLEEKQETKTPQNGMARTDIGNGERLARRHGRDIRYCLEWGKWLIWDGNRWCLDRTGEITRRGKNTVRSIYNEAAACGDDKIRAAIVKHGQASENERRLNAMISLSKSEPGIPILPEALDSDPWLLTVKNGTVDLRTGKLLPTDREHYITKTAVVAYDPEAECPMFKAFINRIMDGNEELISFLQRSIGYSLTGRITERCLFILHGVGKNGKSTLLEVVRAIMSEYAMRTPTETLMVKFGGSDIPNDIARLKGARFVSASETEQGQRLAESKIKDLTGGDTVSARFMRGEFFDFEPEFKLWLATNHKPNIRGTDDAIWDRIRLIPFNVRIPEEERDPTLPDKLRAELAGIFRWALEGCKAWRESGLGMPEEIEQAAKEYRDEMDILGEYLNDNCMTGNPDFEISMTALYKNYRSWCETNSIKMISKILFGKRLVERGIEKKRDMDGRKWIGIGLIEDYPFHDRNDSMTGNDRNSNITASRGRVKEINPKTRSFPVIGHSGHGNQKDAVPDLSKFD